MPPHIQMLEPQWVAFVPVLEIIKLYYITVAPNDWFINLGGYYYL